MRTSLQSLYLVQAPHHAGAAAEAGEQDKDDDHVSHVTAAGGVFHCMVCESLGLWSPHSHHVIKAIVRRMSYRGNITVSKAVRNLHEQQLLSVKLWSYNAKKLLCYLPNVHTAAARTLFVWTMHARFGTIYSHVL